MVKQLEDIAGDSIELARVDEEMERMIDGEREEKAGLLENLVRVVKPALPSLSAAVPERCHDGVPTLSSREGVCVDGSRRVGQDKAATASWLFLSPEGEFFCAMVKGQLVDGTPHPDVRQGWKWFEVEFVDLTIPEVIDARWGIGSMTSTLAAQIAKQREGVVKATTRSRDISRTVHAVADLLRGIR